jgi:hypothetical protein
MIGSSLFLQSVSGDLPPDGLPMPLPVSIAVQGDQMQQDSPGVTLGEVDLCSMFHRPTHFLLMTI